MKVSSRSCCLRVSSRIQIRVNYTQEEAVNWYCRFDILMLDRSCSRLPSPAGSTGGSVEELQKLLQFLDRAEWPATNQYGEVVC
jgi:hypothetical protein